MASSKLNKAIQAADSAPEGVPVGIVAASTARALSARGYTVHKAFGPGYILYGTGALLKGGGET